MTSTRHVVDDLTIGAWAVIAHGSVRATAGVDPIARMDRVNIDRELLDIEQLGGWSTGLRAGSRALG